MKLSDLTKSIKDMSEDELKEYIRQMRHNKTVVKPAHEKRVAEVVKKTSNQASSKINKMLDGMSVADKQQLLLLLGDDDANSN